LRKQDATYNHARPRKRSWCIAERGSASRRSSTISTLDDQRPRPTRISRRGWLVGAGGLATAAGLGAFVLSRNSGHPTVASAPHCGPAPTADRHGDSCVANVSFSRQGSGPPLVLLHGLGMSRRSWDPVVEELAQRYSVVTPDLPGFGLSPALNTTPNVANIADAIAVWLRDARIERPHLVGNSLGGAVALELGRRNAAQSATVLSPIGFWNEVEVIYGMMVVAASYAVATTLPSVAAVMARREDVRPLFFSFYFAQSDKLFVEYAQSLLDDMLRSQSLLETLNACRSHRVQQHRPERPTTIAWGADDRLLIGPQDRRAREIVPTARHVTLPNCGHVCMGDDADLVIATIEDTIAAAARAT
jgi:pimeloyl-ACP methyl ester carboxylesterase